MRKNVNGRLMNCKEIKNTAIFRLRNHRNFRGLQSNKTDILIRNNKSGTKRYCKDCPGYIPKRFKTIVCVDCGNEFEVDSMNNKSCRCKTCQMYMDKENARKRKQKQRQNRDVSR